MERSPSSENYLVGKGRLMFQPYGETGYIDLGNSPDFSISIETDKLTHYNSRSGLKVKDLEIIKELASGFKFTLEEFSAYNLSLAFLGTLATYTQGSGSYTQGSPLDVAAVNLDRWLETGKRMISAVSVYSETETVTLAQVGGVATGTISGGHTFKVGDTVTIAGATPAAYNGAHVITAVTSTTFEFAIASETTSPATGTITCYVTYVANTDYVLDVIEGLIKFLSTGSIDEDQNVEVAMTYAAVSGYTVTTLVSASVRGKLKFVGDPTQGPNIILTAWDVLLSPEGEVGLISDDLASVTIAASVTKDETNHASNPYYEIVAF